MKFDKLFFMLLAMLCLSGCSKTVLPSDDDQGEETGKHVPSTSPDDEQKIYSVEEFLNGEFGNRYVWVHGYIVGACKRSTFTRVTLSPFSPVKSADLIVTVFCANDKELTAASAATNVKRRILFIITLFNY